MNTHWHPDFYSGANGCFIELFAAVGHVNDLFPKAVMFWTRCLFQHNRAAGSEVSNCSSSLGRSRGDSCLCYLRPTDRISRTTNPLSVLRVSMIGVCRIDASA